MRTSREAGPAEHVFQGKGAARRVWVTLLHYSCEANVGGKDTHTHTRCLHTHQVPLISLSVIKHSVNYSIKIVNLPIKHGEFDALTHGGKLQKAKKKL